MRSIARLTTFEVMDVINLERKLALIADFWKPHVIGVVNDSLVKLVKFEGDFVWHHHDGEDEMFLVIRGTLRMRTREWGREEEHVVGPGECIIVPRGVDHLPIAGSEVHVLLFEPQTTINTGSAGGPRTVTDLPRL
jgi:mannose-6-phosphate isomerase-like protein (cupin superfamily)